jgi:PhnB protein
MQNPPADFPQITPYILYENLDAAVDWLIEVLGFTERYRMPGPDGRSVHAEVQMGTGVVMMGSPGGEYRNPKALGAVTQFPYVYVDDVDASYAKARAAGATIIIDIEDKFYGDRTFAVADPEGQQWSLAQHVRDIAPEDMHP